jgi:hypothetical protein
MQYAQIYEKDFVSRELTERLQRDRVCLIREIMTHIWDKWVPDTKLSFEHEFRFMSVPFRDSSLEDVTAEFAEKGWSLTCEKLGGFKFKFSVS